MSAAQPIARVAGVLGGPRGAGLPRRAEVALVLAAGGAAGAIAGASATSSPFMVALAASALALPAAAALFGGFRRLLLALVVIDIPLQFDVNPGYRDDVAALSALSGWTLSLTTCAIVGLYLAWAARLLVGRDAVDWRPRLRAAAFPLLFLALMVLSLRVAQDRTLAGFEINLLAQLTLLLVYLASTVRSRADVSLVIVALLVGLCLESLVALLMFGTGIDLRPGSHAAATGTGAAIVSPPDAGRLAGTFGAPNAAGSYFAFMVPLAIGIFMSAVGKRLRQLALAGCVLGLLALALTLSRGAWIAFVVAAAVLVMGSRGSTRRLLSPRARVTIVLVVVLVLVPLSGAIAGRLLGDDEGAASGRVPLIEIALRMIGDHPLFGLGANNFIVALPHYAGPKFSADWLNVVHNRYLLIWTEAGIGALVAFVLFLATTVRNGWRARRNPTRCCPGRDRHGRRRVRHGGPHELRHLPRPAAQPGPLDRRWRAGGARDEDGLREEDQAMTDLSVVLITKNQAWNVDRLVGSVLRELEGGPSAEVLLVDSGSDDGTPERAARHPIGVLRLLPDQTLTAALGRYLGGRELSGELVLFLDGDMELCPGWLSRALRTMHEQPDVASVSGTVVDLPVDTPGATGHWPDEVEAAWRTDPVSVEITNTGGAALHRRSVLDEVGSFQPFMRSEEEPELCLRIRAAGHRVLHLGAPIALHYSTPSRAISTLLARRRRRLYEGMGQAIRHHAGTPLGACTSASGASASYPGWQRSPAWERSRPASVPAAGGRWPCGRWP